MTNIAVIGTHSYTDGRVYVGYETPLVDGGIKINPNNMKFRIKDRVKVVNLDISGGNRDYVGKLATIIETYPHTSNYSGQFDDGIIYRFEDSELVLISEGKKESTKMALQSLTDLSNLIQRTFNEDTKTLYRAGYLSKDLNITQKLTDALGEMFVGHIIDGTIKDATFDSFATELITRAKAEIAEAEAKDKKD